MNNNNNSALPYYQLWENYDNRMYDNRMNDNKMIDKRMWAILYKFKNEAKEEAKKEIIEEQLHYTNIDIRYLNQKIRDLENDVKTLKEELRKV